MNPKQLQVTMVIERFGEDFQLKEGKKKGGKGAEDTCTCQFKLVVFLTILLISNQH